jgi:hypothetical protein
VLSPPHEAGKDRVTVSTDKNTIGLTPNNKEVVAQMVDAGYFKEDKDAAKFALAWAIREGKNVEPGMVAGATTVWNIGSFDPDGELRSVLSALFNSDTPYRLVEQYVNFGLSIIGEHIDDNRGLDLSDLMSRALAEEEMGAR